MTTIYELRRAHRAKVKEAKSVIASIEDNMTAKEAQALERKADRLLDEADQLQERMDAEEESRELEAERRAGNMPRPPYGENGTAPAVEAAPTMRSEHEQAFDQWLRAPRSEARKSALVEVEQRTASGLTDAAGGHVVPEVIASPLVRRARDANPFRPLVRVLPMSSSDVTIPLSNSDATSGWVGEGATRTATGEPTLEGRKPTVGTVYSYVSMTEAIARDAQFSVANWLIEECGAAIGEAEAQAIVSGDGTNKPSGMLHVAPEAAADGSRTAMALQYTASGAADDLDADPFTALVGMMYSLKAGYRRNAAFAMNSETAGELRKLKDSDGRFLWQEPVQAGQPPLLLGHRVILAEQVPSIGTDAHPILFGDFGRAYALTTHGPFSITAADRSITEPGVDKIYLRARVGGVVVDENAVRVFKCAAS